MKLVAHCLGLSKSELDRICNFKSEASVRIVTQNQLTQIVARGVYDDLIALVSIITEFKTFEIQLR